LDFSVFPEYNCSDMNIIRARLKVAEALVKELRNEKTPH
jgi:hypothetical protein